MVCVITKDNKMKVLKKDSKAWASIIRGNTWVNTLDEMIDLERRTSRRKA